jgi:molybdopterin synthase catalytic subunit
VLQLSFLTSQREFKDLCVVTEEKLNLQSICDLVADPAAGAISTFIGVTRNNFNGKEVLKLEYEAYTPMAESELRKICKQVREKWDVMHIAMYHKTGSTSIGITLRFLGLVPIGEASVIIAISSVHRTEGLEAVHWSIDELKATVPIWKKEFYADGSSWKGNAECRHGHRAKEGHGEHRHGHH